MDDIVKLIKAHGRIEFCLFGRDEYRNYKKAVDRLLRK